MKSYFDAPMHICTYLDPSRSISPNFKTHNGDNRKKLVFDANEYRIKAISEELKITSERILDACRKLDIKKIRNGVIKSEDAKKIKEYFNGNITYKQAEKILNISMSHIHRLRCKLTGGKGLLTIDEVEKMKEARGIK